MDYNTFDILCNLCIKIMENMAQGLGVSYGFINIMLFCVLEPLAIVCFAASSLLAILLKGKRRWLPWSLFGMGCLCVLAVLIPIIHFTLTLPWD